MSDRIRALLVLFLTAPVIGASVSAFAQTTPPATPVNEAPPPEGATEPAVDETPPAPVPEEPAPVEVEPSPEPPPAPPAPPPAPVVPIKPTASLFTRYELRQHYDRLGVSAGRFTEGDFGVFRTRLGLTLGAIDLGRGISTLIQFSPQATGTVGSLGNTILDARVGLYEGYLRVMGDTASFDLGRFSMNYGESLIIGSLDWHETARSFDGFRARITPGESGAYVDAFATMITEGWPLRNQPFGAGDQIFAGIYADVGPLIASGMSLDVYALTLASIRTAGLPVNPMDPMSPLATRDGAVEETLGARFKHRVGLVDLRAEAGIQFGARPGTPGGDNVDALAYQADAEVGFNFLENNFRVGLEGLYATGNDPTTAKAEGWNQLFPTAHRFLGWSDAFGARTNAASGVLHLMYKPVAGLTTSIDAHLFARPEAAAAMGPTGYAATEIDTQVAYQIGAGLVVRGMYAIFLPDEDFYPDDVPLHYLELELRYDLK